MSQDDEFNVRLERNLDRYRKAVEALDKRKITESLGGNRVAHDRIEQVQAFFLSEMQKMHEESQRKFPDVEEVMNWLPDESSEETGNSKKTVCPECKGSVEMVWVNTPARPGIDKALFICKNENCRNFKKPLDLTFLV